MCVFVYISDYLSPFIQEDFDYDSDYPSQLPRQLMGGISVVSTYTHYVMYSSSPLSLLMVVSFFSFHGSCFTILFCLFLFQDV